MSQHTADFYSFAGQFLAVGGVYALVSLGVRNEVPLMKMFHRRQGYRGRADGGIWLWVMTMFAAMSPAEASAGVTFPQPPKPFKCTNDPICARYFLAASTFVRIGDAAQAHHSLYQAIGSCVQLRPVQPMPEHYCTDPDLIFYYAIFLMQNTNEIDKSIEMHKRAATLFVDQNAQIVRAKPSILDAIKDNIVQLEKRKKADPVRPFDNASSPSSPNQSGPKPVTEGIPSINCNLKNVNIVINGDNVNFCGYTASGSARSSGISKADISIIVAAAAAGIASVVGIVWANEDYRRNAAPADTRDPVLSATWRF